MTNYLTKSEIIAYLRATMPALIEKHGSTVTIEDLAKIWKVSRKTAEERTRREDFPAPCLAHNWDLFSVMKWQMTTVHRQRKRRSGGTPRKSKQTAVSREAARIVSDIYAEFGLNLNGMERSV